MLQKPPFREAFVRLSLLLLAGWCFFKWLLRPLWPLLAAFILACLLERPTRWLRRRTGLPLGLCALLSLLALVVLLIGGGWALCRLLTPGFRSLAAILPQIIENVLQSFQAL